MSLGALSAFINIDTALHFFTIPTLFWLLISLVLSLLITLIYAGIALHKNKKSLEQVSIDLTLSRQALDHTPLEVLCFDASQHVIYANVSARSVYTGSEPLIAQPLSAIKPAFARHVASDDGAIPASMPPIISSLREDNPDRPDCLGEALLLPLCVGDKRLLIYYGRPKLCLVHETNEQNKIFAAKNEALRISESARHQQYAFITEVNHEIRTPLNAIIGYAEMLLNTPLAPREHRFVSIIHRSGQQLTQVFNTLMERSKKEMTNGSGAISEPSFIAFLKKMAEGGKGPNNNSGLTWRLDSRLSLPSLFDDPAFHHILERLIIQLRDDGKDLVLTVQTAPNDAPDSHETYLLLGYEELTEAGIVSVASTMEEIVKQPELRQEMSALGGSMAYGLREGKPSLMLRFASPSTAVATPGAAKPREGVQAKRNAKLLVVDDVEVIKDLFTDVFSQDGYIVFTASAGAEALAMACQELPAVIFIDLQLEDGDGWTLARQLRQNPETADIPLLVMTGADLDPEGYQPLFEGLIQKPFNIEQIRQVVHRYAQAPDPEQFGCPSGPLVVVEASEVSLALSAADWPKELNSLLHEVSVSGMLSLATKLGLSMQECGKEANNTALEQLGQRLVVCAAEPDIVCVDEILNQLLTLQEQTAA